MDSEVSTMINFPSWDTIKNSNNPNFYKGYIYKKNLCENLYIEIEVLNDSLVISGENVTDSIKFAFCTHNSFPIASTRYKLCKDGYYCGIKQVMLWAKEFEKVFKAILEHSTLQS